MDFLVNPSLFESTLLPTTLKYCPDPPNDLWNDHTISAELCRGTLFQVLRSRRVLVHGTFKPTKFGLQSPCWLWWTTTSLLEMATMCIQGQMG